MNRMASATKHPFILIVFLIQYSLLFVFPADSTPTPTPSPWPPQFYSLLYMNVNGSNQIIDLWYACIEVYPSKAGKKLPQKQEEREEEGEASTRTGKHMWSSLKAQNDEGQTDGMGETVDCLCRVRATSMGVAIRGVILITAKMASQR